MSLNINSSLEEILKKFYEENKVAIENLAKLYLSSESEDRYFTGIRTLFYRFRNTHKEAFPDIAPEDAEYAEKMRLLDRCLISKPRILEVGYDQYDLVLAGIDVQLPVLQDPKLQSLAIRGSRVLQSAGVLSLSDGKILLYPAQGMVQAFFESVKTVPENPSWQGIVDEIMKLRAIPARQFNKYDLTRALYAIIAQAQKDIVSLCSAHDFQDMSINHVSKMLEAATYASARGALERDGLSDEDAGIMGFVFPVLTTMSQDIQVLASDWDKLTSTQRVEKFCDGMRDKVSLLVAPPILESELPYGGFFSPSMPPKESFKIRFDQGQTFDANPRAGAFVRRNDITGDNVDVSGERYQIPKVCFDPIPEGSSDESVLTRFFTLNAEFLQEIDEKKCDPELCQIVLLRLWDAFVNDKRCPVFVNENNDRLRAAITINSPLIQDILFSNRSRLNAVINSDKVVGANADFAKAVEAVAIAWSFPEVMDQEGITPAQKAAFEALGSAAIVDESAVFEQAVDWMRANPGCVSKIQEYYTEILKPSGVAAVPKNRETMLKRVLPGCVKSISKPGDLGRLFNKGSIKKIEELATATSIATIVKNIPSEILKTENQRDLEGFFLLKVKKMLDALLVDFQTLFPDPAFFDQFSDQFSADWKDKNLSIDEKRKRIISGLMISEVFNLDDSFLTSEGQSINYFFVAGLTNAASSFLRGFSERPVEQGKDFYEELEGYINTAFTPNAKIAYQDVFPAALAENVSTFTTSIAMKLSDKAPYDNLAFDQMLLLARSIPSSVLAPVIAKCVFEVAERRDEEGLQYRLNKLFQHDEALFLQSIKAAGPAPSVDPGDLNYLFEQLDYLFGSVIESTKTHNPKLLNQVVQQVIVPHLKNGHALNSLRTLLYLATLDSRYASLSQLVQHLPKKNAEVSLPQRAVIQHESAASISESSERDTEYRKSFLENLDGTILSLAVSDEEFIIKYLVTIFNKNKTFYISETMLGILNSKVPLLNKLQLIGAVAAGRDTQYGTLSSNFLPEPRLCAALKCFNTIENTQEINAVFSSFLVHRSDQKVERERGRSILVDAGKTPQLGDTFAQYFRRWAQFCTRTGDVVPLNLGWAGSPPNADDKHACTAVIASMEPKKKQAFEKALETAFKKSVENQEVSKIRSTSFSSHHQSGALLQAGRSQSFAEVSSAGRHNTGALLDAAHASSLLSREGIPAQENTSDILKEKNLVKLLRFYEYGSAQEKVKAEERINALCGENSKGGHPIEALAIVLNQFTAIKAGSIFFHYVPDGMKKIADMIQDKKPAVEILLALKQVAKEKCKEELEGKCPVGRLKNVQDAYMTINKFFNPPPSSERTVLMTDASNDHTIQALVLGVHEVYKKSVAKIDERISESIQAKM